MAAQVGGQDPRQRARRNVQLALIHAALALAVLGLFFWAQVRG